MADSVLVIRVFADGDDPHFIAMFLQRQGKPPGADGSAVIGVIELIDDQNDFHIIFSSGILAAALIYHFFRILSTDTL